MERRRNVTVVPDGIDGCGVDVNRGNEAREEVFSRVWLVELMIGMS